MILQAHFLSSKRLVGIGLVGWKQAQKINITHIFLHKLVAQMFRDLGLLWNILFDLSWTETNHMTELSEYKESLTHDSTPGFDSTFH